LSFKVGSGSQIFFWHDKWHPTGYLMDCFGSHAVHDSRIPLDAEVSKIIKGGDWYWPFAWSNTIVEIQSRLPEILIGGEDLAVWHSSNGAYSCAATWDQLRVKLPVFAWWKLVWHPLAIPRHSFFLWLFFREAIVTKYQMSSWRYTGNVLCLFCHVCHESQEHIFFFFFFFFQCGFSLRIWRTLMSACLFTDIPSKWEKVMTWSIATLQGKGLQASLGKLCLGACIYHLWQQRNALVHNNNLRTEVAMVKQITWEVCIRILAKGSFKNLDKCIELVIS